VNSQGLTGPSSTRGVIAIGAIFIIILLILGKYFGLIVIGWDAIAAICAIGIVIALIFFLTITGSACSSANWYKHPLGLPAGSVRALIALLFVVMILLLSAKSTGDQNYEPPSWIMGIVGTIIGFYFGDRKSQGENEPGDVANTSNDGETKTH
jgi:hypothetical protein